jgi:hypothetical protein
METFGGTGEPPRRVIVSSDNGTEAVLERTFQRRQNGWVASQLTLRTYSGKRLLSTVAVSVSELGDPPESALSLGLTSATPADGIALAEEGCGGGEEVSFRGAEQSLGAPANEFEEGGGCWSQALAYGVAAASYGAAHLEAIAFMQIHDYASANHLYNNVIPGLRDDMECRAEALRNCRNCGGLQ